MQINKMSSAAMAAAAAMLFSSALTSVRWPRMRDHALYRREFLQGQRRVQVRQE